MELSDKSITRRHNRKRGGFTLIEVLTATAMLGISMVFLVTSLGSISFGNSQLNLRTAAVRGMNNYADLYRIGPNSTNPPFVTTSNNVKTIAPGVSKVETRVEGVDVATTDGVQVHTIRFAYSDISGLPVTNSIPVVVVP